MVVQYGIEADKTSIFYLTGKLYFKQIQRTKRKITWIFFCSMMDFCVYTSGDASSQLWGRPLG